MTVCVCWCQNTAAKWTKIKCWRFFLRLLNLLIIICCCFKKIETSITKGFVRKSNTNLTSLMMMHVWLRLPLTCATVQMFWFTSLRIFDISPLAVRWLTFVSNFCCESRLIWCLTSVLHIGLFFAAAAIVVVLVLLSYSHSTGRKKESEKISWQTKETEQRKMPWVEWMICCEKQIT